MDLSIFDAFEKPEKISNSSHKRSSNGTKEPESSSMQETKRKRSDEIASSTREKSEATDLVEVTVKTVDGVKQSYIPAKEYKFKLDTFQQTAVDHIERGESVLVAAHTSAGKTAVAEYAIAKSLRDGQRVIYTSPIKALSNQKYRDMQEEFKDVGLMTGDITINPNATCLIMTTEILRSMLYRGSEVMREVAWVIYDEVHYMRDKERGVVWEESIILLPHKVRFVFLSATIPNAEEFVGWVTKVHHQPCHVVYTDYRPVPLQHYIFPAKAEGLFLVVDEKGKFREDNFQKAMATLQAPIDGDEKSKKKGGKGGNEANSDLFKIVRLIMDRELDPCIVFSFSKKACETYALQMARLDFNSEEEKDLVEQVFLNAMEALSEDDRQLPQVQTILPLLKRGVGIHHGGLLPILKEIIEILFQEGLIKCLFATETFSIGINMPAKTVVFTKTKKFDGKDNRWITSGEYIQMSGRAGRRGKDDRGIVIQIIDEQMEPDVAKNMIYGASDPLFSSYHLSYNMVLNMLRVEDADPENLLKSSFYQYQKEKNAPELERQADELHKEALSVRIEQDDLVAEYHSWHHLLKRTAADIAAVMRLPENILPFLQAGRLVNVRTVTEDWGWGSLVTTRKLGLTPSKSETPLIGKNEPSPLVAVNQNYVLDVLLNIGVTENGICPFPYNSTSATGVSEGRVVAVALSSVQAISAVRLNLPKDLSKDNSRKGVIKALNEIQRRFSEKADDSVPLLDPLKDMGISSESFLALSNRSKDLQSKLEGSAFHQVSDREERFQAYSCRVELLEQSKLVRSKAQESQVVSMREDLKKMKRVLKRLGYTSADGVLGTKGRFSCELSTPDELVLTDMVFDGVFNDLKIEQAVALVSCFVFKEGEKETGAVRTEMQGPLRLLQTSARNIAKVFLDAKLECDEEEYVKGFNSGLVDVTYAWASGSRFVDICKLTDVFEGSIVRVIRRLEELLRQLATAATAIGNNELKKLFEDGATKIRRGVVFAASLYL